uniref:SGNH hydrolase-type esterase domain-containing protein n=1 Tax=Peronospora matthiolae TaxID=2874970 RepID=A0AAV1URV9_9STRA
MGTGNSLATSRANLVSSRLSVRFVCLLAAACFSTGLAQSSSERRPVFYFIGDSLTEYGSDPAKRGFVTTVQHHHVRAVDCVNRGLSGYNSKWVLEHAMPVYVDELQGQYSASLVTVFLGANDAALEHGPDAAQFVPLEDYRANLHEIVHRVRPLLAPHGQVLLITPPCVIDSMRQGDRSDASAAKYAEACVQVAAAKNVHVLDLHTYFNSMYPAESARKAFFVDGLHLSAQGNEEVGKLLGVAINGMFGKDELARFAKWQLPDWKELVPRVPGAESQLLGGDATGVARG